MTEVELGQITQAREIDARIDALLLVERDGEYVDAIDDVLRILQDYTS